MRYDVFGQAPGDRWPSAVAPGAFAASIRRGGVELRLGHRGPLLATQGERTLRLFDSHGHLEVVAHVRDAAAIDTLERHAGAGTLFGISPSYWILASDSPVPPLRVITEANLVEIAVVVGSKRPVFPGTHVSVSEFVNVS